MAAWEDPTEEIIGMITAVWPDGTFDVNVSDRPSDYSKIGAGLHKDLKPGDSVLLGFYDQNRNMPFILRQSAGHRTSTPGTHIGGSGSSDSWPWWGNEFDHRRSADGPDAGADNLEESYENLTDVLSGEIQAVFSYGKYLWMICPGGDIYEVNSDAGEGQFGSSARRSKQNTPFTSTNCYVASRGIWGKDGYALVFLRFDLSSGDPVNPNEIGYESYQPSGSARTVVAFAIYTGLIFAITTISTGGTRYYYLERWDITGESECSRTVEVQLQPDVSDPVDSTASYQILVSKGRIITFQTRTNDTSEWYTSTGGAAISWYALGGYLVRIFDTNLNETATVGGPPTTDVSPNEGKTYILSRIQYRVFAAYGDVLYCGKFTTTAGSLGAIWQNYSGTSQYDFCDPVTMQFEIVGINLATGLESWSWTAPISLDTGVHTVKYRRLWRRCLVADWPGGPWTTFYDQTVTYSFTIPYHIKTAGTQSTVDEEYLVIGKDLILRGEWEDGDPALGIIGGWWYGGTDGVYIYDYASSYYYQMTDTPTNGHVLCFNTGAGTLRWNRELALCFPAVGLVQWDQETANRGKINVLSGDYFHCQDHTRPGPGTGTITWYRVLAIDNGADVEAIHMAVPGGGAAGNDYACCYGERVFVGIDSSDSNYWLHIYGPTAE